MSHTGQTRARRKMKAKLVPFLCAIILLSGCSALHDKGLESSANTYVYRSEGDCQLRADVYRPQGTAPVPVVLWLHPGGLITGEREWLAADQLSMYLRAGYAVVAIDYRLAPESKLDTIFGDVEAAYSWLIAHGPDLINIDPDRIAVVGHSAGGYLALLTGFRVDPKPKAIVSFYGYGDLTGNWAVRPSVSNDSEGELTQSKALRAVNQHRKHCVPTGDELKGRFDFYVYARQSGSWPSEVSGHDPGLEREWFRRYEPVHNLGPEFPPTLLLHGQADTDVPFSVAKRLSDELTKNGIANDLISHAGWGHVFDQEEAGTMEVESALSGVVAFLGEHVQ